MDSSPRIQLLMLADGSRLIRIDDAVSGLGLERKLNPDKPLVAQKARLVKLFEAMLESDLAAAG